MKRKTVKIISIFLAILLLLSTASVILFARAEPSEESTTEVVTEAVSENKKETEEETEKVSEPAATEKEDEPEEVDTAAFVSESEDVAEEEKSTELDTSSESVLTVGAQSTGPSANVELLLNNNIGPINVVFKNNTTKEEYKVSMVYNGEKYVGIASMPLGSYSFSVEADSKYKVKLSGDTVLFETSGGNIAIEVQSVKNKDAGFGGFLKNNLFTIIVIIVALVIYYRYIYKQKKLNED